eukprot:336025-Pelagomonas_calceolata.AAC.11
MASRHRRLASGHTLSAAKPSSLAAVPFVKFVKWRPLQGVCSASCPQQDLMPTDRQQTRVTFKTVAQA